MSDPGPAPAHRERLSVPWWAWPPVLLAALILAFELNLGHPGVSGWIAAVVAVALAVAALLWLGRMRVEVEPAGELRAGPAHLPVRFVGRVDVVRGADKQRAMGPDLDPTAFVVHRPWIGPAVRVEVLDPDDPTPYWVVSTRRPERLVAALGAAPQTTGP